MEEQFFTVEQVAGLLKMHPKTIQRYIREGKLRAVKFGKGWRISGHDMSVFTEGAAFEEARALQTMEKDGASRATVSAVADVRVAGREEAIRLINALNAGLNSKPREMGGASMQTQYIEPERMVRVTIWGDLAVAEFLLGSIQKLTEPQERE